MSPGSSRHRPLDPLERFSEIVFGLIMVLSFTCAMSVVNVGRDEVQTMFIGAIGCNLAWGIVDAIFYLIACAAENGHNAELLRKVRETPDPAAARTTITEVLPSKIAEVITPEAVEQIRERLTQNEPGKVRPLLSGEEFRGALAVFSLVFASTFPVVLPFVVLQNARLALHASNLIAIFLLYVAGHRLANFAGIRPIRTGLGMVLIGTLLVSVTILLGG